MGAGVAGLACALELQAQGLRPLVLEAAEVPGGRVRTDRVEGFLLDRGFQVLLTAYPEARRLLDYDALALGRFEPGALVRFGGRFHRVSDPWRQPHRLPGTVLSPIGSLRDKLRLAGLRRRACADSLEDLGRRPARTTARHLAEAGLGSAMVERFFRPFLGGIFLERELVTSSRMFEFVFRMFAQGDAALPAAGMEAIPRQMAATLAEDSLRCGIRVERIEAAPDGPVAVSVAGGARLAGRAVVLAVEGPEAARLAGEAAPPPGRGTTCLYYAAGRDPVGEPILLLNGEGDGPVNNLCVPSAVSAAYAPPGRALISVSVVGVPDEDDAALEREIRAQLASWFGREVADWVHLRTYRIPYALPDQRPELLDPIPRPSRLGPGLFVCGDHRETGSLQGAMASGRRAAREVAESLRS